MAAVPTGGEAEDAVAERECAHPRPGRPHFTGKIESEDRSRLRVLAEMQGLPRPNATAKRFIAK